MLRDSVAVTVRTRPRAIPLDMITMRKSTHEFPFLPYMSMGRRSSAKIARILPVQRDKQHEDASVNYLYSHLVSTNIRR